MNENLNENPGQLAYALNEYKLALDLWEIDQKKGIDRSRECLTASFKFARVVCIPEEKYLEAIVYLDKAIGYNKNDPETLKILTQTKIGCLYELGKKEKTKGDIARALSFFTRARELGPNPLLTKINEKIDNCNEIISGIQKALDELEHK